MTPHNRKRFENRVYLVIALLILANLGLMLFRSWHTCARYGHLTMQECQQLEDMR